MVALWFDETNITRELVILKLKQSNHTIDELTDIVITSSGTIVNTNSFSNCKSLTTINNSNNIISIGDYAFSNCAELTSDIWLSDKLQQIGNHAFDNTSINAVVFSSQVTIGNYAFSNCSNLKQLYNLQNIASIGNYVFDNCINFPQSISLPECTEIGRYAFRNCTNLSSLIAPKCTFVDYNAFYGTKLWNVDPV